MKQIFHKITSITLALIVLFSSFSFTVNKHFCGGEVANTTLLVSADNCGMEMRVCENNTSKKQHTIKKEPCCKDTSELLQSNDNNQQAQVFELSIAQMEFVAAFVYTYINKFTEESSISSYRLYEPPLVFKNIQTLFQVFRI